VGQYGDYAYPGICTFATGQTTTQAAISMGIEILEKMQTQEPAPDQLWKPVKVTSGAKLSDLVVSGKVRPSKAQVLPPV
jgi:hypothetical protein